MAEPAGRKDVKVGVVSKAALESGQMDLAGFRMGKQRLVAKKKHRSLLKKVIVEEREERKLASDGGRPPAASPGGGGASRAAAGLASALSLDAPEFVPAAWARAAACGAAAEEPQRSPKVPTPVFVPSWCRDRLPPEGSSAPPQEERPPDAELPVAEALEQMRALKDQPRKSQEEQPKAQPRGADIEIRHYVHQVLSDELDEKVKTMLGELVRFQERAKERDPLKFAKQKRFCVGMREARRAVARNKCKCLILAPNLEVSTAEGGLDETVEDLIEAAREAEVPVVFALSRNRMGKALGKNIRLSIVAVLSAEGAHQQLKEVLKITDDLRRQWVLRHMSQVTSEDAEEARKRAAEKLVRDAERRVERERREQERREEEERKRLEAKAAKEAEKARRAEERQLQIERRRAEKALRLAEEQAAREAQGDRRPEEERRQAAEQAAREEKERVRREAEQRLQEERRRIEEELAARRREAEKAAEGSDSDADSDLPAGFNSALF